MREDNAEIDSAGRCLPLEGRGLRDDQASTTNIIAETILLAQAVHRPMAQMKRIRTVPLERIVQNIQDVLSLSAGPGPVQRIMVVKVTAAGDARRPSGF
jgi:hypothetical protein